MEGSGRQHLSPASRPGAGPPADGLRAVGLVAGLVASLATLSCLTTRNFKDPAGPRYEGSYGPSAAGEPVTPPDLPLRVVTFNIAHAREIDRALGLLRADGPLRDPDLLLLQEMDSVGADRIARELRLNYVYFPSSIHPMSGHEFGTAVLSPWPLGEDRKIPLPYVAFGTRVSRAVTSAVVRRGDLRIRAYAVHLPAPGAVSYDERKEQVQVILDNAAKSPDAVVIGGDFNGRVVGPWFRDAGLLWLTDKLPGTASGLGFWWSFDHIFARGLKPAADGTTAGVVDSSGASDHRPVWVLLEPDPAARGGAGSAGQPARQKRR